MLIRSIWNLTVSTPVTLPRTYGIPLVKYLHEQAGLDMENDSKPAVTFSALTGRCTGSKEFLNFIPDEVYQLTLCGLRENTSKAIAALTLPKTLEFLGAEFIICDRIDETTTYEALYHTYVADEPEPTRRFDLSFINPTAFSQGRLYLPLPVPNLMFRSWLDRWNEFAPVYLGSDELLGYLNESVALTRHRIQSRPFPIHQGSVNGFTGDIRLQVFRRSNSLIANVAELLINYSQFAGTGIKTRLGMGQTTLISGER